MQIPIHILKKSKCIAGIMHIPDVRVQGTPIVILCYGLNGNRVENERLLVKAGKEFMDAGIVFVRFDYIGLGVSDGEFWEVSNTSKVEDVLAVINYIKGCFQEETYNIFLLGFSDGAKIANIVANLSDEVKGLANWSPVFETMDNMSSTSQRLVREPLTNEIVLPILGLWMGTQYLRELKNDSYMELFSEFIGPKFCAYGGSDVITNSERQTLLDKVGESNNVKIITISGASHVFEDHKMSSQLINESIDWFKGISKQLLINN